MRNQKQLHPELQEIIPVLISACKKAGINITITECYRTVAEQDAMYAQGRTKRGKIITKARGITYSSLHQWGVAVDFCLDMDVDGDGQKSDDIFNDDYGLFRKVGTIGKDLGLTWGGDWKSLQDKPHFQLARFSKDGTASYLKSTYGTPTKFIKSWIKVPTKAVRVTSPVGEIVYCQQRLNVFLRDRVVGFIPLQTDGIFGEKTRQAVLKVYEIKKWKGNDGLTIGVNTIKTIS
jgi:hypothetical protein